MDPGAAFPTLLYSQQVTKLILTQASLLQDRAQCARRHLTVHWHDCCAPVRVAQLAMATSLAAAHKSGAL